MKKKVSMKAFSSSQNALTWSEMDGCCCTELYVPEKETPGKDMSPVQSTAPHKMASYWWVYGWAWGAFLFTQMCPEKDALKYPDFIYDEKLLKEKENVTQFSVIFVTTLRQCC